ncbi:MAG: alpha/beta hydrolase [Lactovum sp.]
MSVIRANIYSQSLMRTVDISVILPVDKTGQTLEEFKTLYLLHGIMGSDLDWLINSNIKLLAEKHNLAVVMPSGENACYVDDIEGERRYSQFIGEELLELTRKMFPLSQNREDTYIAGLSMGAYGALINGLKYRQKFSEIGSFSLALIPDMIIENGEGISSKLFFEKIFSCSQKEAEETYLNPRHAIEANRENLPNFYIACGREDFLFTHSQDFSDYLTNKKIKHHYYTCQGQHDWEFWNHIIKRYISYLPLDAETNFKHSGNVR